MGLSLTWLLLATLTGLELVLFQQVLNPDYTVNYSAVISHLVGGCSVLITAQISLSYLVFNAGVCQPAGRCDKPSNA